MSSACDHSYLDLEIVNNDRQGSQVQTNLQFSENRTNPILGNPSNYEMSVVRFEVDTPAVTLPLFIPLLDVDGVNNDLNQTAYTVTMAQINSVGTALTNLKTANVVWSPEDKTATLPKNSFITPPTPPAPVSIPFVTRSFGPDILKNDWLTNINVGRVAMLIDYTNPFWSTVNADDLVGGTVTYTGGTDLTTQPLTITQNDVPYFDGDLWVILFNVNPPLRAVSIPDPTEGQAYTFTGNFFLNPPSVSVPTPSSYISSQDITTGYYNCYNVKWWLSCVNATLDSVWRQVSGATDSSFSPSLVVDDGTNLVTLLTPFSQGRTGNYNFAVSEDKATGSLLPIYLSTGSNPAVQYVLFFNEPLFNLFSGFPSVYYGDTLASQSIFDNPTDNNTVSASPFILDYFIQPINYGNYNIIKTQPPGGLAPYYWVTTSSEYSPVPMWSPIMSLQISSNLLPNLISYTTAAIPYNDLTAIGFVSSGYNSQISDMITDIEVGLTTGSEYKPSVLYIPKGQYRLIDLHGNQPIYNVDFKISWKTKYGQVVAFKLGAQCGANLKLLFRRKRFDLLNLPPYDTN